MLKDSQDICYELKSTVVCRDKVKNIPFWVVHMNTFVCCVSFQFFLVVMAHCVSLSHASQVVHCFLFTFSNISILK